MFDWVLVLVLLVPGPDDGPVRDYQVVEHYRTKQECVSAKQLNTTARQYVCLPVDRN
jgi:hypothetical protein